MGAFAGKEAIIAIDLPQAARSKESQKGANRLIARPRPIAVELRSTVVIRTSLLYQYGQR
jgi:hypothetical protein